MCNLVVLVTMKKRKKRKKKIKKVKKNAGLKQFAPVLTPFVFF